jgi:hypothetical protein
MFPLSLRRATAAALFAVALPAAAHAQLTNVALGKTVTGVGTFGAPRATSPFPNPAPAAFSTLTDGDRLAIGTQWQTGTVWWDNGVEGFTPPASTIPLADPGDTYVSIDLGSTYALTGFTLAADNNDAYMLFTRNSLGDAWSYWTGVFCVSCAPGMTWLDFSNVFFDDLRSTRYLAVRGVNGDGYLSLAEVEAYANASAVPEPATLALLLTGAVAMGTVVTRRRRA